MYRQGDVLIVPVDAIPVSAEQQQPGPITDAARQEALDRLVALVEDGDAPALGDLRTDDLVHRAYFALANAVLNERDTAHDARRWTAASPAPVVSEAMVDAFLERALHTGLADWLADQWDEDAAARLPQTRNVRKADYVRQTVEGWLRAALAAQPTDGEA